MFFEASNWVIKESFPAISRHAFKIMHLRSFSILILTMFIAAKIKNIFTFKDFFELKCQADTALTKVFKNSGAYVKLTLDHIW